MAYWKTIDDISHSGDGKYANHVNQTWRSSRFISVNIVNPLNLGHWRRRICIVCKNFHTVIFYIGSRSEYRSPRPWWDRHLGWLSLENSLAVSCSSIYFYELHLYLRSGTSHTSVKKRSSLAKCRTTSIQSIFLHDLYFLDAES